MTQRLRRALYLTYRLPHSLWQAVRECRAILVSDRSTIDAFTVLRYENQNELDVITAKVEQALALIATVDARRYRRLRQDLRYILVGPVKGAQFWTISSTCALARDDVRMRSVATIALMIVHEGTHARLNRAGLYPWPGIRTRLENRCIKEERSFAFLLQDRGYTGIDKLLAWLDSLLA